MSLDVSRTRRRPDITLPIDRPRTIERRGPATTDGPAEVRSTPQRQAWAERAGVRDERAERVRPDVRGDRTGEVTRDTDRIGARADTVRDARSDLDVRVDGGHRAPAIGARTDGVSYRPGIDSPTHSTDTRAITVELLADIDMATIAQDPVRFQIGDRAFTAGTLLREARENPLRFDDFLRTQGISREEFNELLDDIATGEIEPGHTYDLRAGSDLAQAYRIGGEGGAVVDSHLDVARTEAAAAEHAGLVDRMDVSSEEVEGPGFFQMIADALAEAVAWIGRLFGGSWDPDTATFDGRVDDEHFRGVGREMVAGNNGVAVQALLDQRGGEDRIRAQLLSQRPEAATEQQWARAVDDVIEGMRSGLEEARTAGTLPSDLTVEQQQRVLVYLRANDFSDEARANVDLVLAQPETIRDQALELLTELPEAELGNMLDLFRPLTSEDGFGDPDVQRVYAQGDETHKTAIFETMRADGFRHGTSSSQADDLATAVDNADMFTGDTHRRYLDLVPRVGLQRMGLMTNEDVGLAARMALPNAPAGHADDLLTRFEAHVGNTMDAISILQGSAFELTLSEPERTISSSADRRAVTSAFARNNTSIEMDGEVVDVDRYLSDSSYRRGILTELSGEERPSTQTLVELRSRFDGMLRNLAASSGSASAPSNVRLDVSAGGQLHDLFRLGGQDGPDPRQQLAQRAILDSAGLVDLTVTARGRGSATAHTMTLDQMADIISSEDPEGTFEARFPGLDFGETVAAFATLAERASDGALPGQVDEWSPATVDLTRATGDRALDGIGRRLRDSRIGNVATPSDMRSSIGARSTAATVDPSTLISDAELGGVAGNNWFQYGIFTPGTGAFANRWAYERSRAAFSASGGTPDPAHALQAMYDLDGYGGSHSVSGHGRLRESGVVHGTPEDFLVSPRTGARATGEDFQVLAFVGRGMGNAGLNDARRATRMFGEHGGVPESQIETHTNPNGQEVYDAVRAEIMSDPRPESDRDGPRTVVVYYAGHTGSYRDNEVAGWSLRDRTNFTPEQMRELDQLAQQRGVNIVWWTDACRSGEYVHQARAEELADSQAAGTQSTDVEALAGLRHALTEQHVVLSEIHNRANPHSSNSCGTSSCTVAPAHVSSSRALARLGAEALQGGFDSDGMRALHAERDRIEADPNATDDEKSLIYRYVDAIESTIIHRETLGDVDGLDPDILDHGMVTGDTTWASTRRFSTFTLGQIGDLIGAELRDRLDPTP